MHPPGLLWSPPRVARRRLLGLNRALPPVPMTIGLVHLRRSFCPNGAALFERSRQPNLTEAQRSATIASVINVSLPSPVCAPRVNERCGANAEIIQWRMPQLCKSFHGYFDVIGMHELQK
jgi:hypothetical protein